MAASHRLGPLSPSGAASYEETGKRLTDRLPSATKHHHGRDKNQAQR